MTMRRHSFVSPSPTPTVAASLKPSPQRSDRQPRYPTANPPAHQSSLATLERVKPSPSLPTPSGTPTDWAPSPSCGNAVPIPTSAIHLSHCKTRPAPPICSPMRTRRHSFVSPSPTPTVAASLRLSPQRSDRQRHCPTANPPAHQSSPATAGAGQTLTVVYRHHHRCQRLRHLQLPVGAQCQYRLQRYASDTTRLGQHHLSAHR